MGATPTHTQTLAANGHWKQLGPLVPAVRSFWALSSNSLSREGWGRRARSLWGCPATRRGGSHTWSLPASRSPLMKRGHEAGPSASAGPGAATPGSGRAEGGPQRDGSGQGEPPEPGLGRAGPGRCGAAPAASPRLASPPGARAAPARRPPPAAAPFTPAPPAEGGREPRSPPALRRRHHHLRQKNK